MKASNGKWRTKKFNVIKKTKIKKTKTNNCLQTMLIENCIKC